jgi:hypothetical protein
MKKSFLKVSSVLISLAAISTVYTLPQHTHRPRHHKPAAAKQASSLWSNIFGGNYASAYSGYDLFINGSWINTDNDLLKIDQKSHRKDSFLVSGDFQALLTDNLTPNQNSQLALQGIELQSFTTLDYWFHAFTDTITETNQLNTSLARAFITIGDLNSSDFYLTIGKKQVSFGQYSTSVINVLPEISSELGGITAKSITVGMDSKKYHLNARAYVYKPQVKTKDNRDMEGGIDFVKTIADNNIHSKTGLSLVTDLADSGALSSAIGNNMISQRLPAFNLRETLLLSGNNSLVAEYVSAFSGFSKADILTNHKAVRPGALHIEWNKGVTWLGKPVELALGYNQTYQASAFNLPASRFYGSATISPIRRSALSLEVNDDHNYSTNDVNSIGGKSIKSQDGKTHLSVYLLAGIYF